MTAAAGPAFNAVSVRHASPEGSIRANPRTSFSAAPPRPQPASAWPEAWRPARTRRRRSGSLRGRERRRRLAARRPEAGRARAGSRFPAPTTASPGRSPTTTRGSPTGSRPRRGARSTSSTTRTTSSPALLRRFEKRYDCKVDVAHLQLGGRGDREAPVRRRRLRRHPRPLGLEHRQPDGAAAPAAAQPLLPAEPREEHLAASSPIRSTTGARTTRCPYVVWSDGIGWRNDLDLRSTSRHWTSRGTSSGSRTPTTARSGSSTTSATGSRCRCSATPCREDGSPT